MKFKYKDEVRIKEGFYEGKGTVIQQRYVYSKEYLVVLDLDGKEVWVSEHNLKPI